MKFNSKKVLSMAAIAAILSTPTIPYTYSVVEAAQAELNEGFYIVSKDNSKFYSITDLFGDHGTDALDAINDVGFDSVYLLQDGAVIDLWGFFEGVQPTPYEAGVIPGGQYVDAQGITITVEKGTVEEVTEFKVLRIE